MSERTSGAVEGWNRILKCIDHPRHRLRPDVFIYDHWQPLTGRQLTYIDQLNGKTKQLVMVGHNCIQSTIYIYISLIVDLSYPEEFKETWKTH